MKMNIQIRGVDVPKGILKYVNKTLSQLSENYPKALTEADVRLKYDTSAYEGEKICEIYLKMPGRNIFAIQKGSSFEKSIDKTILKLQNQIKSLMLNPVANEKAEQDPVV